MPTPVPIPVELDRVLRDPALARAYIVGGAVRDALLGLPLSDIDVEVFGLSYDDLARVLASYGRIDVVGQSFGVVKLTVAPGLVYDFSIPRRDSRIGVGHKGFAVEFDPHIEPRDAAARRDFTINALMFDPRGGEVLDFFGGQDDLRKGTLRHVGPSFDEDPLRVLRGMQFAGRFGLTAHPTTLALANGIVDRFAELSGERIREEWLKWAASSRVPSAGLRFLRDTGWIRWFPELKALIDLPQDPAWHPEGDVFVHTGHCCDALAALPEWLALERDDRAAYMLAVLCHDLGKAVTTHEALKAGEPHIVSPGHEEAGGELAERFLERLHAPGWLAPRVVPLVKAHLAHLQAATDRAVRRLAKRIAPETIRGLALVMTADAFGRPPLPQVAPPGVTALLAQAERLSLEDSAPKPILMGRHLIELGMTPGKTLGTVLDEAFEAQLDGAFFDLDGALQWLREHPPSALPPDTRESER